MITKTGVHCDIDSNFSNPLVYEENGQVNRVVADNLTPSTRYYTRAYVVSDGTTVYSGNIKSFETLAAPDYFTITNNYNGANTINLHSVYGNDSRAMQFEYSLNDGQTWLTGNYPGWSITLQAGENVKIRHQGTWGYRDGAVRSYAFGSTQSIIASGDMMSLIDPTLSSTTVPDYGLNSVFWANSNVDTNGLYISATTIGRYGFSSMFHMCSGLTNPPTLPANATLDEYSFSYMFAACSSLTTAPNLPNTTLTLGCYQRMFEYCSSLTQAPTLPATTLVDYCYREMFSGCSSLNRIVIYANDISAYYCIKDWVSGVSATGDFYNLGSATYPTNTSGIPSGWTVHTSL